MGHKVPPYALRLGINKYWRSRWIFRKNFPLLLEADFWIRKIISENHHKSGVVDIIIERKSFDNCKVNIYSAKPGYLVGKDGKMLKNLITKIDKKMKEIFYKYNLNPPNLDINVLEVKKVLNSASYISELIALDLEKGLPTRKVLKKISEKVKQQKDVLGFKVLAKGRVDGATIKRKEQISWGRMPLSKLTADIDYAFRPVLTKYGIVGIKVWLYKGDKNKLQIEEDVTT